MESPENLKRTGLGDLGKGLWKSLAKESNQKLVTDLGQFLFGFSDKSKSD